MSEILVFCERDEIAFELLSKGKELKDSLKVNLAAVKLGKNAEAKIDDYFAYGADIVYWNNLASMEDFHADVYTEAICQIANNYGADLLLIGSTKRGKELAPRVAQKLGAGCITDAIDIRLQNEELVTDRYALGGNTVLTQSIGTAKKVISVMPKAFEPGEKESRQGEIVHVDLKVREPRTKIVEKQEKKSDSAQIEEAETLICVGRGISEKKDLALIEELSQVLKASIGCTRPLAHDWQWFSEEREVGLSGKKCKPRLCISIGISGQIQHTVGIRNSKIIAAVNKDKNAPIFKIADYGIVADLYQVVPKLTEKIKKNTA
ncbi:MAG: electron transfer flavoprotein subunit alpha/FixB family protein [Chloroflexota bacterium]